MERRRQDFTPDYISEELACLGKKLPKMLTIYVLGGAVMAMEGLKPGTRDLDVIVENEADHKLLVDTLEECGYVLVQPQDLGRPYVDLSATALENVDGLRWEVFIHFIAKKLYLSEGMKQRSSQMHSSGNITVQRLSNEDLFLLKAMTERDRDLEDMSLLSKTGLDYDLIFDECRQQSDSNSKGHIWEASLNEKLKELELHYGIRVPFRKKLEAIAEEKMLASPILNVLGNSPLSQDEILSSLPEMEQEDIIDGLNILLKSGKIKTLKDGRYRITSLQTK